MKKKYLFTSVISLLIVLIVGTNAYADYLINVTSSFSLTMRKNAAYIAYYAYNEEQQGTYPIGTGEEFASKVKTGGPWDYKQTFGSNIQYIYNDNVVFGEDLGNMHYGYVGRGAGFSDTLLKSAAGAYQIYSGTSSIKWYASYFDDPNDQKWIQYGIDMWNKGTIPISSSYYVANSLLADASKIDTSLFSLLTPAQKKEIEEKVKKDSARIKKEMKAKNQPTK